MMEIKLTDKQFEQLQVELIKEVIHKIDNGKKKFIDVTIVDYRGMRDKPVMLRQVSIYIEYISALISVDDAPDFKTEIIISGKGNASGFNYFCISSIGEIKQMIKEVENNER